MRCASIMRDTRSGWGAGGGGVATAIEFPIELIIPCDLGSPVPPGTPMSSRFTGWSDLLGNHPYVVRNFTRRNEHTMIQVALRRVRVPRLRTHSRRGRWLRNIQGCKTAKLRKSLRVDQRQDEEQTDAKCLQCEREQRSPTPVRTIVL